MALIKINEVIEYQFIKIPKVLFEDSMYIDLSLSSKVIYGFLLDRMYLSQKNNWFDENNNVYLKFTREKLSKKLKLSEKTITKSMKELKALGLIDEKRIGLGSSNVIYIGKLKLSVPEETKSEIQNIQNGVSEKEKKENQEPKKLPFCNSKIYGSKTEKSSVQDTKNLLPNNTNINNTNNKNTEYSQSVNNILNEIEELDEIKKNCELHLFEKQDYKGNVDKRTRNMVENIIEQMFFSKEIEIDKAIIPQSIVRNKMKELNAAKIFYALDKLKVKVKNSKEITNSTKYLVTCVYNAINEYMSDAEIEFNRMSIAE